ncbi:MAG TPA: Coenzyme F420 hydrogenase/dehydrogenase, beta subunit C-terminal domain [Syntrophomonadaceae bacterium]|nr:Coenzyme F420 hydrogenase/dehydrogenase, beta subunit C-terminal domain [Syntrophomonadaceae bacterium]HPR93910.1 Coenzyme F420 hydrogenase/dehydrogenase, beta subunit C-terminal domain [Syntrophomonadaceae bacterium]
MPGGMELKNDVFVSSVCALCGACLDWCPYIANIEDHLVMRFDCYVADGRCYSVCPRTFTDWQAISDRYLPDTPKNIEIGPYYKVYKVKASQGINGQQDGGTVSNLVKTVMEDELAETVLLTGTDDHITPEPFLVENPGDIEKAAGSRFLASPGLRKIIEAQEKKVQKLAVVGRPCQIQALRKLGYNQSNEKPPMEVISIGLFCMWSLGWDFKEYLAKEFPGEKVLRMGIPQHGFVVTTDKGEHNLPLDEVKRYIKPGCSYCLDMTSELADISVGAFEAEEGWNTVIVRSQKGQELFSKAVDKGYLICEDYPEDELNRLKGASIGKKNRNLENIQAAFDKGVKPFIDLNSEMYVKVKKMAEGMVK